MHLYRRNVRAIRRKSLSILAQDVLGTKITVVGYSMRPVQSHHLKRLKKPGIYMPNLCCTLTLLLRPSGLASLFVFIFRSMLITSLSYILIVSDCRSLSYYSNQLHNCQIVNKKHLGYLQNYGHSMKQCYAFLTHHRARWTRCSRGPNNLLM